MAKIVKKEEAALAVQVPENWMDQMKRSEEHTSELQSH